MILKQYYLGCLAHASYLIGDEASSTAIVVDPQRDIQQYLADAEKFGLQIRHVFLSHFHADFVAGHLELRDRCGAAIHLGARAQAEYAFVPMKDGDTLNFPGLRLQILETPGHTIESISILVFDLDKDPDRPHAVLTGDTLFIGDVGRPDLRASLGWTANDLGAHLYESLHTKLLTLPDETLVYPAHGAGSLCGKQLSSDTVSSLGDQRRFNYALQPMSKEQFIRLVTADQPDAPAYFTYDAILNTRERTTLDKNLERTLHPIDLDEVLRMGDAGLQVLDVATPPSTPRAILPAASTSDSAGNSPPGRAPCLTAPGPSSSSPSQDASTKPPCVWAASVSITSRATCAGEWKRSRGGRTWSGPRSAAAPRCWPRSWPAPTRPWCSTSGIHASGLPDTSPAA